jgi:hypothetical protein
LGQAIFLATDRQTIPYNMAVLPRSTSSSSACGCIEPFGIVLAVMSVVLFTLDWLQVWWWPWRANVGAFLWTLVAVMCLFRAAKGYQNERGLFSSSSVGMGWMVVSWVFCTVAGVMAIVDAVFIYSGNISYYQHRPLVGIVTLICMSYASVCMLIYAEKSRRRATGHMSQSATVVVRDPEAPVHDEPSIGTTPPTVIAEAVRGSVLAQEETEQNINHNSVEVLPTGSYYVPHNKDQCRSVVAPAPRAMVIGEPIHDGSSIVEQQGQRHRP